MRPIVSITYSVTYNIAKHLTTIIAPLVGKTPHHIQNSFNFISKDQYLRLALEEVMVSYDVTSIAAVAQVVKQLSSDKKVSGSIPEPTANMSKHP